jgi:hypothetical protein
VRSYGVDIMAMSCAEEREDGHEVLGVEWEIEVVDKDGKVTDRKRGRNSLLTNFAWIMSGAMDAYGHGVSGSEQDTGGTLRIMDWYPRNIAANYLGIEVTGGAGTSTYGIVVGSDSTAVTADDYKLNTQIAHGVGAGQLSYLAVTLNAVVVAAPTASVRIDRQFTNGSGGDVTVKELGIYIRSDASTSPRYFCICRDVIPDTLVPNGSSLNVKYTVYIST